VAAQIAEDALYYLDAPIKRVASHDVPMPFAPIMENFVVPSVDRIVDEVRKLVSTEK
jgi:pyruvate dehydrogenase E1 component beta subunit